MMPDDDAANDRNHDHPQSQMIVARATESERNAMKEEDVGEQANEVVKQKGNDTGQHSNHHRHNKNHPSAERSSWVGWLAVGILVGMQRVSRQQP